MHRQHFSALDLNLLRVFDALLEERSVTRAGARLGLTQSAVSHALGRLRYAVGDELFVRRPGGMTPTARAMELGPQIHAALLQLQTALGPVPFNPAETRRGFNVMAGPYASATVMPDLIARLRRAAPGAQLRLLDARSGVVEGLDSGRVEAAIGSWEGVPERYVCEKLIADSMVWVVRAGHPAAAAPLSLAGLAAMTHVVMANPPETVSGGADGGLRWRSAWEDIEALEQTLSTHGLKREVGVVAPDTFSALAIVTRSDMVTLAPRRLAQVLVEAGRLQVVEAPTVPAPVTLSMLYRRDRAQDPAQAWLLGLLREAAGALDAPAAGTGPTVSPAA